ncbi:MAG: PPOX class F420-dependent oxidoreductase [Chloroflexota bacterium]
MSNTIPETHLSLLTEPVYVTVVTMLPDGQPQATVVWCSHEDGKVAINTAVGRKKDKNMVANPKVTIMAINPENPYHWLEVRGTVASRITEDDGPEALEHINALAKAYAGKDAYFGGVTPPEQRDREVRVKYKIEPTKVTAFGSA